MFSKPANPKSESAQIDFSDSLLLDICDESPTASQSHSELDYEPFEYDHGELSELIEFDLPEDLPGKFKYNREKRETIDSFIN